MNVKDVLTAITMVAMVVLLITLLFTMSVPHYQFQEKTYIVMPGDCLWKIASKFCPKGMDKWEYIDKVYEANKLTTYTLQPGQVLTVFEVKE